MSMPEQRNDAALRCAPLQSAWLSPGWCAQLQPSDLLVALLNAAVCRAAALSCARGSGVCAGCDSMQHRSCCTCYGPKCVLACFVNCLRTVTTKQRWRACLMSRELEIVVCCSCSARASTGRAETQLSKCSHGHFRCARAQASRLQIMSSAVSCIEAESCAAHLDA